MNDFKEKIEELIIDHQEQELNFDRLTLIYNWPELSYYDEDTDNTKYEYLQTDNCAIITLDENHMTIVCGGDTQEPHMLNIELLSGELAVTTYEPCDIYRGMDYEEVVEILTMTS